MNFISTETQTSCDCLEETCSESNSIARNLHANKEENSITQNTINTIISKEKDSISINKSNEMEETSNTFLVFTDDEIMTFRTTMKRKLNLMDEDEVVTAPSKKPFIGAENGNWAFEHRTIEPLGDDDKSIPSSFNSVDDGEQQSQQKHVSKVLLKSANVLIVMENDKCNRDGEVEANDLVNVQMNLKDLKVCDVHHEKRD
ncbi:uncharacterized protein TNCT_388571 [Trichonephila clavata]|uniref:Uncharacterized protein n=1 Tax=Trichonephila clavata TaxID=2740835 RepID=A0A8X6FE10_TRICU|nr:uncharacterized protein TNCT_388571 [Trichonephila clavata]